MISCPKCQHKEATKSGVIDGKQRYKCKACKYHYTVDKVGKQVHPNIVLKGLQLYLEGLSFREIERIINVSHVTVINWVKLYKIKRPFDNRSRPNYRILKRQEVLSYLEKQDNLALQNTLISPVGDKFIVIVWNRYEP